MGYGLAGTWKAVAKQATFDVTPIRSVKPGAIADLVIASNGTGYTYRKTFLGEKQVPLTWDEVEPNGFVINIPELGVLLIASMQDSKVLVTLWESSIRSVDGMSVIYQRY